MLYRHNGLPDLSQLRSGFLGGADLQSSADCPIGSSRECRQATGRGAAFGPPRRGIALKIEAPCLRGKLPRLWYAQDPAAIAAGGLRYRPFHVARLMRVMGLQGNIRGKRLKTTFPDKSAPNPLDRMNRPFDNAVGSLAYDG